MPLNLVLDVRVLTDVRAIEIVAMVGKRRGFPAERFVDRDVTARVTLPRGLELEAGTLTWNGDLHGDQVASFMARVKALHDTTGVVEVTAIGHAAVGGRVDADSERFYVTVRGDRITVSLDPPSNVPPTIGPRP